MNLPDQSLSGGRMDANLRGLIEHIELSATRGLVPLYEAVSNALDAIQERELPTAQRKVEVRVLAAVDLATEAGDSTFIPDGFEVVDNGVGFNGGNLRNFKEAFTLSKEAVGGKGMGRFTYLKVFSHVSVESVFEQDGARYLRTFTFTVANDVHGSEHLETTDLPIGTRLVVKGMDKKYLPAWPRDPQVLAARLVEHFLIQFAAKIAPQVTLQLPNEQPVLLNKLFDSSIQPHIEEVAFTAGEHPLHLQVFRRVGSRAAHECVLCSIGREVSKWRMRELLPELPDRLVDGDSTYSLIALVTGEYLDYHTNRERTQILFQPEDSLELDRSLLSKSTLKSATAGVLREVLNKDLNATNVAKVEQITRFVERAPEYRALLSQKYRTLINQRIAPGLSDEKLDEALLHVRREIEDSVTKEERHVAALMEKESFDQYETRLKDLIDNMNDVGKAKLAAYVGHRRAMIDLLSHSLKKRREDDAYPLEKVLHKAIFPMGVTSNEIFFEQQNLWMIDERLCFHTLLTSDKKLKSVAGLENTSGREPDIFAWFYDHPVATAEAGNLAGGGVVIIEFKRPGFNSYDKDPAEQILLRIDEIMQGNVDNIDGRPINPNGLRFAGYFIADLTSTLKKHVRMRYNPMPDGEGYFCTLPGVSGYIEIISYDRLVNDARKRNRMFFEKLGLHKD